MSPAIISGPVYCAHCRSLDKCSHGYTPMPVEGIKVRGG